MLSLTPSQHKSCGMEDEREVLEFVSLLYGQCNILKYIQKKNVYRMLHNIVNQGLSGVVAHNVTSKCQHNSPRLMAGP